MIVRNYGATREITHDFDEQILGEGIADLVAAPILVGESLRGLLYAGFRAHEHPTSASIDRPAELAESIAGELRTRDEVDRRVAAVAMRDHVQRARAVGAELWDKADNPWHADGMGERFRAAAKKAQVPAVSAGTTYATTTHRR